MADILAKFDQPIRVPNGDDYFAQAVGKEVAGGLWEGWLEFLPRRGGSAIQSGRETTQPNRTDLEYWAQGLTMVYLEGALARAIALAAEPAAARMHDDTPDRDATARRGPPRPRSVPFTPRPILDPFRVYAQGESVLRSELRALSREHLDVIATAYDLSRVDSAGGPRTASTSAVIEAIVEGVRSTR